MFKEVEAVPDFPKIEEKIIEFWKKNKIFERSVEARPAERPWTFLDGPPFVTGMPHYGSLLSSLPKDLFGRYWTMKGYHVRRVWGWDGHGLPIENKVEEALKVRRKKDIETTIGVQKFIDECKKYVEQTSSEWEWYIDHIGRWVDFKNAYKTWDLDYMESVMWVFRQMYDKGFIYKGFRVTLYCPHCATPISNFETALDHSYKEVVEAATIYKYRLKDPSFAEASAGKEKNTYILAWSTTPWNKIVTPALAVNPKFTYVRVEQDGQQYILAKTTLHMLKKEPKHKILEEFKGSTLVGKEFIPHYDYYTIEKGKKAFEVIGGDFVTAEEGTGVVTIAAYGVEDLAAMKKENIHIEMHLDEEGIIKSNVPKFGGMYYLKANPVVNEDLSSRGLIYKDEDLHHNVPICWRCATRLYYAPLDAWFVDVQKLKSKLLKTNEKVNWYPKHFKEGRFQKSMEAAPDWNISRNRYWGSPVPVWECECGERFVPGSIKELEEASGMRITDLHKPFIDEVTVLCKKCGKKAHRTPEVLDSWIEAGSASFAERHFPFEPPDGSSQGKPQRLDDFFPPDFIAEYTGQIRAWFYVLHVIGTALYDSPAFKNVLVEGVILGTDGRKMSKNYGNYPDPKKLLLKYGGDALRLYLMGSPVMKGEDIIISEDAYRAQVRGLMLVLWNVYKFFVLYANPAQRYPLSYASPHVLDKWIMSLLQGVIKNATRALDNYDTVTAINEINDFIQSLSTWYIRRSRSRAHTEEFLETLHIVLVSVSKLLAPIAPFIAEELYKNITDRESVHLEDWPVVAASLQDEQVEKNMNYAIKLSSLINGLRKEAGIKVRIPLRRISYSGPAQLDPEVEKIVKEETNVYDLTYKKREEEFAVSGDTAIKNQDVEAGEARGIVRMIQQERKRLGTQIDEKVDVELSAWPEKFEEEIKKKAHVASLKQGHTLKVTRASRQ